MLQLLSWQFLPAFPSLIGEQTLVRTGSGAVAVATFVMMPESANPVDHTPHWLLPTGERLRDVVAWASLDTPHSPPPCTYLVTLFPHPTPIGTALSFDGAVALAHAHERAICPATSQSLSFFPAQPQGHPQGPQCTPKASTRRS